MAGVKGKGGMKGRSGGPRPGSGRKPKLPPSAQTGIVDGPQSVALTAKYEISDGKEREPLEFLLAVQNDPLVAPALRVRAAIAAAQYIHTKKHDGGKKEEAAERSKKAAQGRFGARQPPKLVANG